MSIIPKHNSGFFCFCSVNIIGSFHVGAHDCEELTFYNKLGLKNDDMMWIEKIILLRYIVTKL
jgi:hypothetical protein